ncbi:MAG: DUF2178 domain-containing protein [Candidatus Thorarchaeota archaeon]
MDNEISNRSLVVLLIILAFSMIIGNIIMSYLSPSSSVPLSPPSIFAGIVSIAVLMGVVIYGQRFRDERSIQIFDKSARNGFAFVLYGIPILIVTLSVTGYSPEVLLTLTFVWIGAILLAGLSAFYYYWR